MFRNAGYWFAALLAASGFAFWPRYLSRLRGDAGEIDGYTHLHAAVATAWCLLLIVQPFLLRAGRRDLHRKVGALGYVVAPALAVASVLLAHQRVALMSPETFAAEAAILYLQLSGVLLFSLAFALAIVWRRTPALHGRFMIATGLVLIDPVIGRLIGFHLPPLPYPRLSEAITYGLCDAILLLLLLRPRMAAATRTRFAAGAAVFPIVHAGWFTLAQGEAWLPFARWFRELPLT